MQMQGLKLRQHKPLLTDKSDYNSTVDIQIKEERVYTLMLLHAYN